jgi:hypothetical protein
MPADMRNGTSARRLISRPEVVTPHAHLNGYREERMPHFEDPFEGFDKSDIWHELDDKELQKLVNSLSPEEGQQLRSAIVEAIAASLEQANKLPVNQTSQTEALGGKYNFVVHKFCWGALRATYAVIKQVLKVKAGAVGMDLNLKEGVGFVKAVRDVYSSIETPCADEWAIIEVIEIFNFRRGDRILTEPGPTINQIEAELAQKGLRYDDLPTRIVEMEKRTILRKESIDGKTYYQIRYVSELIVGGR